ncbi:MAG: Hsp20/alpha crystallin family protein [Lachnospiraceae bacterium]|nr:Hsp20/alpha crystallin family protein [Lachnospiraceae bacterium]
MLVPSIFGEDLFDSFFDDFAYPARRVPKDKEARQLWNANAMRTDVKETDTGFELDIDLPGYKKEEVSAELKEGYLTIKAETKNEHNEEDKKKKYIRQERYFGSCQRSFYVGEDVTEEDIKAKFDNGTLKLFVPKKEHKEEVPEKKFIAIEG